MKNFILRLGQFNTVILITLVAILSALILLDIISFFIFIPDFSQAFTVTVMITMMVTPILSWYVVKLIFHINALEIDMRQLATYDSLTNLSTRKSFLDSIGMVYKNNKNYKYDFSILYIDVDNFKNINDTYGHTMGDIVLESLGKILLENKRGTDYVGRIGGEEFSYALPNTNIKGALYLAQRIKKIVENDIVIDVETNIKINYTISIGISMYNTHNEVSLRTLIAQADKALYKAKAEGKNCIKVHQFK